MSTLFSLTGRRAVVTGGGSGIGLAIAGGLASFGADVVIWGRDIGRLDAAIETLSPAPGSVTAMAVDVTDEAAVANGMNRVAADLGGLEIVVVNAGTGGVSEPFVTSQTDHFHAVMATNLDGAYWTMREGARVAIAGGNGGSIIAISSLAATEGATHNQAYGASKGGLLAMANGAAVELARHSIRVNTILPGWIATDMTTGNQQSTRFSEAVIPRVPLRRWGQPEDFVGAAVYLAGDSARFQTGSTVVIDGGYSIF